MLKILPWTSELVQTSLQLPLDIQAGKISIEEARECLQIDKQRSSKELNKFFRENKGRGISPSHQQLWQQMSEAYKKCYDFLYAGK